MVPWLILKLSKSRSGADFQKWPKQSPDHYSCMPKYFRALTIFPPSSLCFSFVWCGGASTWSKLARTGVSRISDSFIKFEFHSIGRHARRSGCQRSRLERNTEVCARGAGRTSLRFTASLGQVVRFVANARSCGGGGMHAPPRRKSKRRGAVRT